MTLALYRKYRPRTFAEIIGQEHVTEPLSQALRTGRLHHAYLFSGPRGCGKTSSARILARSLNCEQGPTPDPCGVCDSCRALAPDGAGSIDVIEIDAASHGGVDDARELRERAFFAPVSSRYKIYVIDEAHMVSSAGFNALLKLVEEPPDYVKFVFATTEPEKVLGTIKSRTHHYPFRLIPPAVLRPYLEQLCVSEGVTVQPAVLPLVVRAGAGSARDTLSVLDQLISGAGPEGVTYARAVALLGVTDAALIDEMVDALAAGDGATAFATIDRVADAGHDARRFAGDLLERLRDLIVAQQVPDAIAKGLLSGADDELDRMGDQAVRFGAATLSRMADILHTGLVDMRGTTAPRLVLELLTARMLLPGAEDSTGALLQRLERMERRLTLTTDGGSGRGAGAVEGSAAVGVAAPVPSGAGTAGPGGGGSGGSGSSGGGSGSGGGGRAAALAAAAAAANGGSGRVAAPNDGSGGRVAGGGSEVGVGSDAAGGVAPGGVDGVGGAASGGVGVAGGAASGGAGAAGGAASGGAGVAGGAASGGAGVAGGAASGGASVAGGAASGGAGGAGGAGVSGDGHVAGGAADDSALPGGADVPGGAVASGADVVGGAAAGGAAVPGGTAAGSADMSAGAAGGSGAGAGVTGGGAGLAAGAGVSGRASGAPRGGAANRNTISADISSGGPGVSANAGPVPGGSAGVVDAAVVRRIWDEVLTMVKRRSQRAAAVVREATVREVDGDTIVLLFKHGFHAQALAAAPELLQEALYEVLGGRWKIRCELSGQQGAVVADIPGRPASGDGSNPLAATATAPPQPRGSAQTASSGSAQTAPSGSIGPTAPSGSAQTAPSGNTGPTASATAPGAAGPTASMPVPTVRTSAMSGGAGTAPDRRPSTARSTGPTGGGIAGTEDAGGGVAVAIADDDEWPEIAQIGLDADPAEDAPTATLHTPATAQSPTGVQSPTVARSTTVAQSPAVPSTTAAQSPAVRSPAATHAPQAPGGIKAPAGPKTAPVPKTQTRTQPSPTATRPAPGQGRAAARAAAAAAAAHKAPPKPARAGDDVWAGTTGEEPPFDPEFDATRPGFDPGDEPVDDLDDAAARLTTEQQALDLLREHLGAEKIGEIETK